MKDGKRWREMFYADDVFAATKPLDDIRRFLGVNPFSREGRLSYIRLSITTIIIVSLASTLLYGTYNLQSVRFMTTITTLCIIIFYTAQHREETVEILKNITLVDNRLSKLGMPFSYSTVYIIKTMFFVITPSVYHILLVTQLLEGSWKITFHTAMSCLTVLPPTFTYLEAMQPILLLDILARHFRHIKGKLRSVAESEHYQGRSYKVQQLVDIFSKLSDIGYDINTTAGRKLHVLVAAIFIQITLKMYYLYIPLLTPKLSDFLNYLHVLVSTSPWIVLLLDTVTSSAQCQNQAKEFTTVLYNMMIEDKTKDLLKNERLQLHMIMKREVKFTASGFFPLDNTLIHSVIAAAATYLILLIQFGPKSA